MIRWIAAGTAGFTVAGVLFHFPGSFPVGSGSAGVSVDAGAFGAVMGAISGVVAGALLWLAGRPRATAMLVPATALGFAVTHALGDGLPSSTDYVPIGLIGGLVLGVTQWYALRERPPLAAYALTSTLSIAAGILVGLRVIDTLGLTAVAWTPGIGAQQHGIASAVTGLLWSVGTAWRLYASPL